MAVGYEDSVRHCASPIHPSGLLPAGPAPKVACSLEGARMRVVESPEPMGHRSPVENGWGARRLACNGGWEEGASEGRDGNECIPQPQEPVVTRAPPPRERPGRRVRRSLGASVGLVPRETSRAAAHAGEGWRAPVCRPSRLRSPRLARPSPPRWRPPRPAAPAALGGRRRRTDGRRPFG